jgi:hypothetical protein
MLARRLTTILPTMTIPEALETTRIHRVAGLTGARTAMVTTRPFRAPHHTISDVGLTGGGTSPCRVRCRLGTRAGWSGMHGRHAGGPCLKCCAGRSWRGSHEYDLAHMAALVARAAIPRRVLTTITNGRSEGHEAYQSPQSTKGADPMQNVPTPPRPSHLVVPGPRLDTGFIHGLAYASRS